jgi:formate dehydrogenase maturation protein FdhE
LATGPESIASATEALGLNSALAATVLRMVVLPALAQITRPLAELRQGVAWQAGYCPNCGSWPLLGEARGLEQERFLRCGLCAAAWPCDRLFCPFCGQRDHHALGYLHVEGEEDRYRAGTCDECKGYVKWVSTILGASAASRGPSDFAPGPGGGRAWVLRGLMSVEG